MQKFLNVETINLRPVASTAGNSPIGALTLGQVVEDLGDGPPGWHHVQTTQAGQAVTGFIVDGYADPKFRWTSARQPTLRDPASPAREALVAAAIEQWLLFKKGTGKETVEPYNGYIGKMWKAFGENRDGRDTQIPWSAVAISLMVRNAARTVPKYAGFPESEGHAKYMWESIKAAASGDLSATFWGVKLPMATPQVGDIVGSWRDQPFTFDQYLNASKNPQMPSHCDIVVSVGVEVALAIGGNVQNSVFATGYQLGTDGFLTKNQRITNAGALVGEAIVLMTNRVS